MLSDMQCDRGKDGDGVIVKRCPNKAVHGVCITDADEDPITLCNDCFKAAFRLGMIKKPFWSKEEFDQNEKERMRRRHA